MRPLLIFGASKGVGLELARQECKSGRTLFALVRPSSDAEALLTLGVTVVRGDALSSDDVAHVFSHLPEGCDVVSTLGGQVEDGRRADDEGNINVITVAKTASKGGRFVLITSIGCGEMAPFRSERAIAAFGAAVDAKTRAEEYLRQSALDWTIIRPGGLVSEPATGNGILVEDAEMHGFINRADVADLAYDVLRDPSTTCRAFAAVDSNRANSVNAIRPFALAG